MQKSSPHERFRRFSRRYAPRIDAGINSFFEGKIRSAKLPMIREMYEILLEYCARDGKRLRPLVLLMSYLGYGGGGRDAVVRASAALELMHSFLLIQDDIIDRSPLRRGGKSLHEICGEKYMAMTHNENIGSDISLVLADILFANALEIISESAVPLREKNRFLKIFSATYEITALGQIFDILHSSPMMIEEPLETPLEIASMKTAYYTIYHPMLMGYMLTGKNSAREKGLIEKFSIPLGLAFQLKDDISGVFGNEKATGKPSDSDIKEGKFTVIIESALRALKGKDRERFVELFTKKKKSGKDAEIIRELIRKSECMDEVTRIYRGFIDESYEILPELALVEEYRLILKGLIEAVADL
jgi:geranylgeranyl diphosphate synthase, type I